MPYTMDTLPDAVKKLPAKRQRQWLQIWNSSYARCAKNKSGDAALKTCETLAFKSANGVVQMSADEPQPVGEIAVFDLDTVVPAPLHDAGDVVYRTGLVFRAGDYPDKDFAMTPEELSAAVEAFNEPLPIDLEHVPTLLDQKLGELVSVEASEDGSELHGIVALPKWLDAVLPERKVSATWDRATKTLAGLALVRNPRVSDAALMAAFGEANASTDDPPTDDEWLKPIFAAVRHDTPEGQMAMQELHNAAARGGAVCKASNAKMASGHESSTIQKIHDMTTDHGAKCSAMGKGGFLPFSFGSRKPAKGDPRMSRMDEFVAWLKGDTEEGAPPAAPPVEATVVRQAANSAEMSAAQQEIARYKREADAAKAETLRVRAEARHREAVTFADQMIAQDVRKAFPAERESIIAQFEQASLDDATFGVVTFGEGEQERTTSRVEMLKAQFAARPAHQLTMEQLKPEIASLLENRQETFANGEGSLSEAQLTALLERAGPLGRQAASERRNGGSH